MGRVIKFLYGIGCYVVFLGTFLYAIGFVTNLVVPKSIDAAPTAPLGFLIAFWAAPTMTVAHLVFALATTAYILIAIQLEERDLVDAYGDDYRQYRQRVSMLMPVPPKH